MLFVAKKSSWVLVPGTGTRIPNYKASALLFFWHALSMLKKSEFMKKMSDKKKLSNEEKVEALKRLGIIYHPERPFCAICKKEGRDEFGSSWTKVDKARKHFMRFHSYENTKCKDKYREGDPNVLAIADKYVNSGSRQMTLEENMSKVSATEKINEELAIIVARHSLGYQTAQGFVSDYEKLKMMPEFRLGRLNSSATSIKNSTTKLGAKILRQLVHDVKNCKYAIAVDESCDSSNWEELVCFIRFIDNKTKYGIREELLFCRKIHDGKSETINEEIRTFLEANGIALKNMVAITTDGAQSMLGKHSGLQARMRALVKESGGRDIIGLHCAIHKYALITRFEKSSLLQENLNVVTDLVLALGYSPLKSRMVEDCVEENGKEVRKPPTYVETRWLSKAQAASYVFGNFQEISKQFEIGKKQKRKGRNISENGNEEDLLEPPPKKTKTEKFEEFFRNENSWTITAFLADWLDILMKENIKFQGKTKFIANYISQMEAFKQTIEVYKEDIRCEKFEHFKRMGIVSKNGKNDFFTDFCVENARMLDGVKEDLQKLFPEELVNLSKVVLAPFDKDSEKILEKFGNELALEDLRLMKSLGNFEQLYNFENADLVNGYGRFWTNKSVQEFSHLWDLISPLLIAFPTTYCCESAFSHMKNLKTPERSRLEVEEPLRIKLWDLDRGEKIGSEITD